MELICNHHWHLYFRVMTYPPIDKYQCCKCNDTYGKRMDNTHDDRDDCKRESRKWQI